MRRIHGAEPKAAVTPKANPIRQPRSSLARARKKSAQARRTAGKAPIGGKAIAAKAPARSADPIALDPGRRFRSTAAWRIILRSCKFE